MELLLRGANGQKKGLGLNAETLLQVESTCIYIYIYVYIWMYLYIYISLSIFSWVSGFSCQFEIFWSKH